MEKSKDTPFADPAQTWNRRFSQEGFLFGTAPNAWLAAHDGLWRSGERVLCVADGEGRNSVWLASRGLQVDAFDLSTVGVVKAHALAKQHGVTVNFAVADCDALTWPAKVYDSVVAIFVQFASPDMRARLFNNMMHSLKPGGTLLLHGYTPKQLDYKTGGPPLASHMYTEAMLREAFASLDIVELKEYEAVIEEGQGHHGRSALIGLVAKKR